jgi:hypothetical protein
VTLKIIIFLDILEGRIGQIKVITESESDEISFSDNSDFFFFLSSYDGTRKENFSGLFLNKNIISTSTIIFQSLYFLMPH